MTVLTNSTLTYGVSSGGGIREDLEVFGIRFDRWFSERAELHQTGAVPKGIAALEAKGLIYRGTLPPPKGKDGP